MQGQERDGNAAVCFLDLPDGGDKLGAGAGRDSAALPRTGALAMVTFEVTDQVRETIQQTLFTLLGRRRNVFLG